MTGAERKDEIGVLARAFNEMTGRLTAANAHLADAVRVRDEFISIASHELKTPLTALKLQLQNLLRVAARDRPPHAAPTAVEASAGRLERLVSRVATLVENMLDVSRLTSGRLHRAHGGELSVRGDAGQGATFVLRVPAAGGARKGRDGSIVP